LSTFFFLSLLLLAIVLSVLFDECGIWLFMCFVSTNFSYTSYRGRRGHDHMVVGLTTTCVISVYQLSSCEYRNNNQRFFVIFIPPLAEWWVYWNTLVCPFSICP
jgi:hypothetical protein